MSDRVRIDALWDALSLLRKWQKEARGFQVLVYGVGDNSGGESSGVCVIGRIVALSAGLVRFDALTIFPRFGGNIGCDIDSKTRPLRMQITAKRPRSE